MGYLDTLMAQMSAAPQLARVGGTVPIPAPRSGGRGRLSGPASLMSPGRLDPSGRVNFETGAGTFTGQPMPGMTRSGQPQVGSYQENPYMNPAAPSNQRNPSKAYWGGWFDDILGSGAGGRGTSPFSLGPQRRQQAEAYNRGETKQQLQMNQMQYDRWEEQNKRKTTRKEKDTKLRNITNSYVDALKSGKFKGGISEWLTLDEKDRSKIIAGSDVSNPTGGNVARTFTGGNGNIHLIMRDGSVKDTGKKDKPGSKVLKEVGGVTYVEETLPGGETLMTKLSEYEQGRREGVLGSEASAKSSGKATGTADAKLDTDFRSAAANEVPLLRDALRETQELTKAIESGQFTETGPFESLYKKYTNKETAQLHAKSITKALENLQITNLAPVSNFELDLIADLYANIGNDPAANLGILKEAEALLTRKLNLLNKKRGYWMENEGTLKGYGLDEKNFGEDWMSPMAAPDPITPLGGDRDPEIEALLPKGS